LVTKKTTKKKTVRKTVMTKKKSSKKKVTAKKSVLKKSSVKKSSKKKVSKKTNLKSKSNISKSSIVVKSKQWTRKDTLKVIKDIKALKIQGATAVAKFAVEALHHEYLIDSSASNINEVVGALTRSRPTEPMMRNAMKFYMHLVRRENVHPHDAFNKIMNYFDYSKRKVAFFGSHLIEPAKTYYTHCHSSDVMGVFKKARETKLFRVFNTETRPLFQGRKSAIELAEHGIPVVHFVDSAARVAIKDSQIVFLGSDAITNKGEVFNKIGSEMIAELANNRKVPVYICTASWKLDPYSFFGFDEKIEERNELEIWENAPNGVILSNYAFEKVNPKYIKGIISEFGILTPKKFVKETKKHYPWMFE
jgi:eIF-2B alpha/beta/delta-like uncharacterized protein